MVKVTIPSQVVTLTHALVSRTLSSLGAAAQATIASAMHTMADVGGVDDSFGGGSVSMNASGDRGLAVPDRVRAHAFVALGKLCLRDGALAKKVRATSRDVAAPPRRDIVKRCETLCGACRSSPRSCESCATPAAVLPSGQTSSSCSLISAFGTRHWVSIERAVRGRSRVSFTIVMRYVCLSAVDRFVPTMATCIKDRHPMIRKHAVITLTQLLLEDYVKLRGSVFFQYLSSLADPDVDIRETAVARLYTAVTQKASAGGGCRTHFSLHLCLALPLSALLSRAPIS
jgi:hypothetical protein